MTEQVKTSRQQRRAALRMISKRLASGLYGHIASKERAEKDILALALAC